MKLASLKSEDNKNRDGHLVVVSRDLKWATRVQQCPTLLEAVRNWSAVRPVLQTLSDKVNQGSGPDIFPFQEERCTAPLPNAPGFYDGSAFLSHVVRARRARGDEMPPSARITPLMYQGVSDALCGPHDPLSIMDPNFGGDFEGEFAVVTSDVPRGTKAEALDSYCILFLLFNDITYREIVKNEIETKFGFLQSKPNSSFAAVAVTADELGAAWKNGRIHLDMDVRLNGQVFGNPNGTEMNFSFQELIAHACRTRPLSAGSIVGTGTVSNESKERGFACLTEKRFQEIIEEKKAKTPWLQVGDRVEIEVRQEGQSVFGKIDQRVTL